MPKLKFNRYRHTNKCYKLPGSDVSKNQGMPKPWKQKYCPSKLSPHFFNQKAKIPNEKLTAVISPITRNKPPIKESSAPSNKILSLTSSKFSSTTSSKFFSTTSSKFSSTPPTDVKLNFKSRPHPYNRISKSLPTCFTTALPSTRTLNSPMISETSPNISKQNTLRSKFSPSSSNSDSPVNQHQNNENCRKKLNSPFSTLEEAKSFRARRFSSPFPFISPENDSSSSSPEKNASIKSNISVGESPQKVIQANLQQVPSMERNKNIGFSEHEDTHSSSLYKIRNIISPKIKKKRLSNCFHNPQKAKSVTSTSNVEHLLKTSFHSAKCNKFSNINAGKLNSRINANLKFSPRINNQDFVPSFLPDDKVCSSFSTKNNNSPNKTQSNAIKKTIPSNRKMTTSEYLMNVSSSAKRKHHKIKRKASVPELDKLPKTAPKFPPTSVPSIMNSSPTVVSSLMSSPPTLLNKRLDKTPENAFDDVEMLDLSSLPSLDILSNAMEIDSSLENKGSFMFVIDTNVFIHNLSFIDELKDTPLEGHGPPTICIPWMVVCELDSLKTREFKNKSKVLEAIRYIYYMFDSKHPRFHGQSAKMSRELKIAFGTTNDDQLLSYCVLLSKTYAKQKVCLLTDDKNLCSKALMNEMRAYTIDKLFTKIKPDIRVYSDKNLSSKVSRNVSPSPETTGKMTQKQEEADAILCEAKFLLKTILLPFLNKSMENVFGELSKNFLTPPPVSLLEILELYKKYWISVFGPLFEKNSKGYFECLTRLLNYRRGYLSEFKDISSALSAIEGICKNIYRNKGTAIDTEMERIQKLVSDCRSLCIANEIVERKPTDPNQSRIAIEVFNHIWLIINQLCGMILDKAGFPHTLNYNTSVPLPALSEFQLLLSNIIPAMHKLRAGMSKVMNLTTEEEIKKHEIDYKRLYDYLLQFIPSLEIQAYPPPTDNFSLQCLKAFFMDPNNKDQIKAGFEQLLYFQELINNCVRLPIWKT